MSERFIFGFHALESVLANSPERVQCIWVQKGRDDQRIQSLLAQVAALNIVTRRVSKESLAQKVTGNHQGVVAELSLHVEVYDEAYLKSHLFKLPEGEAPFLLVLDGVTDPHNLGACLRTAEAAGVHFVIVPKDNSAPLSATAIKVACGAAEVLPLIRVTNLVRTLEWLKSQGVWVAGAAGEASLRYDQASLTGALALVMGAEGAGLRRLTRQACDFLLHIPMRGQVSSLNVSVATGVCLFEALKQRTEGS